MRTLRLSVAILGLLACLAAPTGRAQNAAECATLDFETLPGTVPSDGLEISTQFEDSLGVSFALEDGTFPHLAQVGAPLTAFEPADTPNADQGIGTFFLTDDGVVTTASQPSPLIVTFSVPVDSAAGAVLDIDFSETFTIQARDDQGAVLEEIVITAGDAGTGSGAATHWEFGRPTADVASIRFVGQKPSGRFGLGFDLFTTCAPERVIASDPLPPSSSVTLESARPNPAIGATDLVYGLAQSGHVRVDVLTLQGRQLAVLVEGPMPAGRHTIRWTPVVGQTGTYLIRIQSGTGTATRPVTVVR